MDLPSISETSGPASEVLNSSAKEPAFKKTDSGPTVELSSHSNHQHLHQAATEAASHFPHELSPGAPSIENILAQHQSKEEESIQAAKIDTLLQQSLECESHVSFLDRLRGTHHLLYAASTSYREAARALLRGDEKTADEIAHAASQIRACVLNNQLEEDQEKIKEAIQVLSEPTERNQVFDEYQKTQPRQGPPDHPLPVTTKDLSDIVSNTLTLPDANGVSIQDQLLQLRTETIGSSTLSTEAKINILKTLHRCSQELTKIFDFLTDERTNLCELSFMTEVYPILFINHVIDRHYAVQFFSFRREQEAATGSLTQQILNLHLKIAFYYGSAAISLLHQEEDPGNQALESAHATEEKLNALLNELCGLK